jgi:uncharacterized protein (DUF1778 family)
MKYIIKETTRFEARLLKEQKALFEKASILGGFRNLTEFIVFAAQEKARVIIKENEQIISSVEDAEIFYEAIVNPAAPSEKLTKAFKNYQKLHH